MRQPYKPWLKLWADGVLCDDSDIETFGIFIKLLCLASQSSTKGVVCAAPNVGFSVTQLARILHVSTRKMRHARTEMQASEKIAVDANGCILILKWQHYQSDYTRVQRFRERRKDTPVETAKETPVETASVYKQDIQITDHRNADPPLLFPPKGDAAKSSTSPAPNKKPRVAKSIDAEFLAQMATEFPDLDIQDELERMQDYDADKGRRHKAPRRGFRNWLKNARDFRRDRGPPAGSTAPAVRDDGAGLLAKYGGHST